MAQLKTYYDTLQVSRSANEAVIRAAYRTLTQKYHPDKNLDNLESSHRDAKRLNEAYEVLSDPVRRAAYDDVVQQQEAEMSQRQASESQSPRATDNRDGQTQHDRASQTDTRHHTASPREKAQGRSRFEESTAGATSTDHRESYASTRKTSNPFTSFLAGFRNGSKSKATPSKSGQTRSAKVKSSGLTFWNVIVLCLIGGWIWALAISKSIDGGHERLGFFNLLFDPSFLGVAVAPTGLLVACAGIGWTLCWLMPATREHAAWGGLVLAAGLFLAVSIGNDTQQLNPATQAAASLDKTPKPSSIVVVTDGSDAKQLYSQALKEIEAKYPALNPDLPGYRKDLIDQAVVRMETYVKQGNPKHNALKLAIADMEGPPAGARSSPAAPSFAPSTYAPAQSATKELTIDERVTISLACNDYQISGNISGFQSCMRNQTARAAAGNPIPSMAHLTIDEKVTIGMACNDYQINGDISAFQSCMRAQIAKTMR